MNFEETDIQKDLRALARKFADKELKPVVDEDENAERFRPEFIEKLGVLGLTGITSPEEQGGAGLGYQELSVVLEEIAKVCTSYAISIAVTGLPQIILNLFGNQQQKQKYIPPLAKGKAVGAFSLSEASSGSDAASLRTSAVKDGDYYVLNGTKLWCTQADSAETFVIMARTLSADVAPGPKGISSFLVEKGTAGLTFGKKERKMGCHISHTMELILTDLRLHRSQLIGQEGNGFRVAMTALDSGRITIASIAVGVAQAAFEVALTHSKERKQFDHPLIDFQGISFMLADMAVGIESSRLLVQRAAWLKDSNRPFSMEAAMAKLYATDVAMKVTTDAVQILGGSGYTQDFPVERWMREAKVLQIVEGTNQIQRLIIGRSLSIEGDVSP